MTTLVAGVDCLINMIFKVWDLVSYRFFMLGFARNSVLLILFFYNFKLIIC